MEALQSKAPGNKVLPDRFGGRQGEVSRCVEVKPGRAEAPRLQARKIGKREQQSPARTEEASEAVERRAGLGEVLKDVNEGDQIEMAVRIGGVFERAAVQPKAGNGRGTVGSGAGKLDAVELRGGRSLPEQAEKAAVTAADVQDAGASRKSAEQVPGAAGGRSFAQSFDRGGELGGPLPVIRDGVRRVELGRGGQGI